MSTRAVDLIGVPAARTPSAAGLMFTPRYAGESVGSTSGEYSPWHAHPFGQLITARRGSLIIGTRNRVLLLSPAMVLWIPPDAQHWMRSQAPNEMLFVDVTGPEAAALGDRCRVLAMTPILQALMAATLPGAAGRLSEAHRQALFDLLRFEICNADDMPLSVQLPEDRRIRPLADAALKAPDTIRDVSAWIASAPASRKTVERLFVNETGMTPSRWLRHVRLLHAVVRLSSGEKVGNVALDLGYGSSSAFTFMFRQTLGLSPRAFATVRVSPDTVVASSPLVPA